MTKTKVIKFDVTEILSYEEYKNIIKNLQLWYKNKMKNIRNLYQVLLENKDYSQTFEITKEHNQVVVELIHKIISYFNLQDIDIAIYLSNSFARETNLIDSDIDLNFMYEDIDRGRGIEELISDILTKVMSKYRDFVHDSISHRIPKSDIHNLEGEAVIYELTFRDRKVTNRITSGNESLMYKLFNSHKDLNSFAKYYTGYLNDDSISEWLYFQKEIYSSSNYLDALFSYVELTESKIGSNNLECQRKNLLKAIQDSFNQLNKMEFHDMAKFKKLFKNDIYRIVYETLTLLKKSKKIFKLCSVPDLLPLLKKKTNEKVNEYFGSIMLFNYVCDLYGIEFRTRYSNSIPNDFYAFFKSTMKTEQDFPDYFKTIATALLEALKEEVFFLNVSLIEYQNYNPLTEQINIENYSPLSYINNISKEYQHHPFLLPFIKYNDQIIPMHPDTLDDLHISRKDVYKYELVYPTSSFRTVYSPENNIFYKIPVLRQITRSIRDMKNKELKRSEIAQKELAKYACPNFYYLEEKCFYNQEEIYNYIVRESSDKKVYPWFYCIASQKFSKEFQIKCIDNMIRIWMFYAAKGIYFESAHTQNFLVDENANVYYRDLSDIRILEYEIMTPSYIEEVENKEELLSVFFDRSMCSQNIEHFIKYCKEITPEDINHIKKTIAENIEIYNLAFPDYSMNYDKNRAGHHPIKTELVRLRKPI